MTRALLEIVAIYVGVAFAIFSCGLGLGYWIGRER